MALTKQKKHDVVASVSDLLDSSKMTVVAKYQGTTVKALQSLRKDAKANGTKVTVVKNRLVVKALEANDTLKGVDTSLLKGQLLYAFNSQDEVAPAQSLAAFAKKNPTLEFVGAITSTGEFMNAEQVKVFATLPSKNQLIAGIVNTLQSPLRGVMGSLSGNIHGYLKAIEVKNS